MIPYNPRYNQSTDIREYWLAVIPNDEGFTFHSDTDLAWRGENVCAEFKVVIAMVNLLVDVLCRRKHEDSFTLNRRLGVHS